MSSQLKALEAFAADPELLRLKSLLKRFNLFEAIGVIRQELRHSDLLRCLLDPTQSHGLSAIFLRAFLRDAQQTAADHSILSTLDLDALNLNGCSVEREWHRIDILVIDDVNHFAIIIENKIDTKESQGQLQRYLDEVSRYASFQGYQIIALYLTPEGDEPSLDSYSPVSYTQVCEVIGRIVASSRTQLSSDIVLVMEHYSQMLRRHIVGDSDVAVLCGNIYREHKQALDTIFEHVRSQEKQIGQYVSSLIQQTAETSLGMVAKNWVIFGLKEWEDAPPYISDSCHLYFEFHNRPEDLKIFCTVSPGDPAAREKLFSMAQKHHFPGCQSRLNRGHCRLATIQILRPDDYDKTQDEIEALILEKWDVFIREDLPWMTKVIREEEWLWALP